MFLGGYIDRHIIEKHLLSYIVQTNIFIKNMHGVKDGIWLGFNVEIGVKVGDGGSNLGSV